MHPELIQTPQISKSAIKFKSIRLMFCRCLDLKTRLEVHLETQPRKRRHEIARADDRESLRQRRRLFYTSAFKTR